MSENETANAQGDARLYELGVSLVPTLDNIDAAFEKIKGFITSNGGTITADSKPALIELAYTMGKNVDSKWYRHNTAYFGWVKFMALGDALTGIKEELDTEADVLRYMITKTTPEASTDAIAVAQAIGGDKDGEPSVPEEVEVEEVEEEVVDAVGDEVEKPVDALDAKIEEAIEELVEVR